MLIHSGARLSGSTTTPTGLTSGPTLLASTTSHPRTRGRASRFLLSGLDGDPQNHKETIYALFRQGRRTVFPDSPHGIEARPRANLPMARIAPRRGDLMATLKHQGIDEADAIAHSAGAISLEIAGTTSGGPRFRNVVLQNPAGLCGGETVAGVAWRAWQESRQETRRQRWKPTERQLIRDPGRRRMYWLSTLARTVAEVDAVAHVDIRELLIEMRRRGGRLAVVHGADDRLFSMERMQRHVDVGVVDGFYSWRVGTSRSFLSPRSTQAWRARRFWRSSEGAMVPMRCFTTPRQAC